MIIIIWVLCWTCKIVSYYNQPPIVGSYCQSSRVAVANLCYCKVYICSYKYVSAPEDVHFATTILLHDYNTWPAFKQHSFLQLDKINFAVTKLSHFCNNDLLLQKIKLEASVWHHGLFLFSQSSAIMHQVLQLPAKQTKTKKQAVLWLQRWYISANLPPISAVIVKCIFAALYKSATTDCTLQQQQFANNYTSWIVAVTANDSCQLLRHAPGVTGSVQWSTSC